LYKIAENHNFNEDYDAVIQDCKKLLKDAPFKYRAQLMLGAAYIKKGNLDEASVQLEEGLAQYPNELSALFQMGSIYVLRIQKELSKPQPDWQAIKVFEEKGIIWYNRIFNIRYDIEKAWNNLGFIYEKQSLRYKHEGNEVAAALSIRKAEESYSKAVELNSLYVEAIVNKASLFLQTSRNEEATILLLKVLEVTLDGVEKKETELTAIINKGNLENSVAYISINKDRVINRQAFLRVAPKVIGVLKAQLFKLKNYQDYLVVLECELKLKIYQKIDEEEQFNIAKQELEDAKISSDLTQNNARLQLLEKTFNSKKDIFDKATLNLAPNIANLLLQKAEIFSLQNKKEEEVAILKRINVLAETKEIPEQNCEALLKLNAIYMNSSESELRNLLPVIESNFKKASFAGNPALNEFKTGLMKKFMSIKQ
jgi:outer membrane protein assembly factor BamD (BamD/ComL family)